MLEIMRYVLNTILHNLHFCEQYISHKKGSPTWRCDLHMLCTTYVRGLVQIDKINKCGVFSRKAEGALDNFPATTFSIVVPKIGV